MVDVDGTGRWKMDNRYIWLIPIVIHSYLLRNNLSNIYVNGFTTKIFGIIFVFNGYFKMLIVDFLYNVKLFHILFFFF